MRLVPLDPSDPAGVVDSTAKATPGEVRLVPLAPGEDFYSGPTEMRAAPGLGERAAEEVGRGASYLGGAALGGPAGAAVGGTLADLAIALLHHHLYGTPINITPGSVTRTAEGEAVGSYAGEGAGTLVPKALAAMGASAIGKTSVEQAAVEAAEKQGAKNLGQAADVYEKSQQQSLVGQERAYDQSAGQLQKTAKANLANRREVSANVPVAQAKMNATKTEGGRQMQAGLQSKAESEGQSLLPEAKVAATQSAAGTTGASTAMAQSPERIARDESFREAIKSPLIKWRQDWGIRRNTALAPYMESSAPVKPTRDAVLEELAKWPPGHAPYTPEVANMLSRISEMKVPGEEAQKGGSSVMHSDIEMPDGTKRSVPKKAFTAAPELAGRTMVDTGDGPQELEPKVKDWLTMQAQANRIAASSKGANRTAAQIVSRGIDETLAGVAPTPELKALNAEYRNHRLNFPYKFEDAVDNSERPVDAAPEIFNHPQRALDLIQHGDAGTRQQLGQLYADWVSENGSRVIDKSHQPFLRSIFPNTPFADPKAWVFEDRASRHLADVIDSHPEIRARFDASMMKAQDDLRHSFAKSIVRQAFTDLKGLGPAGERVMAKMRAAKNPEEAADIATKFYESMTPDAVAAEQKAAQPRLSMAAPTEAAQRAALTEKNLGERVASAATGRSTPQQAALSAIQRGYDTSQAWHRVKMRASWLIPYGLGTVLTGHPSAFVVGSAIAAGALGAREMFVRAFQNSLRDPALAREFYQSMLNPGAQKEWSKLATSVAKAGFADATANLTAGKPGAAFEDDGAKGVKALDTHRAEHLAPTPSASARALKVNEKLAKGKQPDVHRDLTKGRLAVDEANKLVQYAANDSASKLVEGMPLTEAMDSVEMASPQERTILMPLLKQRLQRELPKQKNMTLAANLTKRFRQLETIETV